MKRTVFLDAATLGEMDLSSWDALCDLTCYDSTSPEEVLERCKDAEVVITNKVILNEEVLSKLNLECILITATGTNNIDLDYAKSKNIMVRNITDYASQSVAQHTLAFALHLNHGLSYYHDYIASGEWSNSSLFTHHGRSVGSLSEKKWGIVGLGNIGLEVASTVSALGCHVMWYSTSGKNTQKIYDRVDTLRELFEACDIISIHCPLNSATKHLINEHSLDHLKEGAILINMSRGGVVNEQDLIEYFNNSNLRVALDVMEQEPTTNKALLDILSSDRIICTPHNSWGSLQARKKIVATIKEYLEAL
ncbi:NAD(P)-binding domain-containing protein [Bacteriovoracaceae bacterium]|nr:NAD(P)-binding domain-containing protein [Bacteriovoracaceae bacterium]